MMDKFKTKSGAEYNCSLVAEAPIFNKLYVAVTGMSFVEAASLFSNADEMSKLTYAGNEITGYTHLDYVMVENFGIKACLSKEAT